MITACAFDFSLNASESDGADNLCNNNYALKKNQNKKQFHPLVPSVLSQLMTCDAILKSNWIESINIYAMRSHSKRF